MKRVYNATVINLRRPTQDRSTLNMESPSQSRENALRQLSCFVSFSDDDEVAQSVLEVREKHLISALFLLKDCDYRSYRMPDALTPT